MKKEIEIIKKEVEDEKLKLFNIYQADKYRELSISLLNAQSILADNKRKVAKLEAAIKELNTDVLWSKFVSTDISYQKTIYEQMLKDKNL